MTAPTSLTPAGVKTHLDRALRQTSGSWESRFLTALNDCAVVYGFAKLAEDTGLSREALYKTLSPRNNPRVKTIQAVLKAFGLQLTVGKAGIATKEVQA